MSDNLFKEVMEIKEALGKSVVIPAHHYQMDEIVQIADFIGDSYKLAVDCSATDAEYIVFCGVMFMAEGAALLAKPHQKVLIPDKTAGCPMAEMIDSVQAEQIYSTLSSLCDREIIPIVYMNSYADMKAFCGIRNGTVCTSSNATKIVKHFLDQGKSVFFAPDYNLGVNTANKLNLDRSEIVTVQQNLSFDQDLRLNQYLLSNKSNPKTAKMFIWDGFCHVHKAFNVDDINSFRKNYIEKGFSKSDINVIVHPECSEAVVNASDYSGSTSMIWNKVRDGKPGSVWAVGTELRFVERIAEQFKDKKVVPLRNSLCHNMSKITLEKLGNTLKSILNRASDELLPLNSKDISVSRVGNIEKEALEEIKVEEKYKKDAKKALELMINIVEDK